MPARSYATLAALRVSVLTSGIVRSRGVHGSEVRTEQATFTGFLPNFFSIASEPTIAAAAPSPVGQHM